jgi:glycosyltransferase involved in cell wall biosynthesis
LSVSVVVPTHDRVSSLERCVEAVLADDATTQLVVVDDGSQDHTQAFLDDLARREPRLRVVRTEGEGPSVARQAGLDAATGDVVLIIDDDVVLSAGTVAGHRDRHAEVEPGIELVVVGYMPIDVPGPRRPGQFATYLYAREYENRVLTWEAGADVLDTFWMGNVSALRSTWHRAGLNDRRYPALPHQDRDLGLRMGQAGMVGRFDRSLGARHIHERTLDQFLSLSYRQGVARWHLARIHGIDEAEASALGEHLPWFVAAPLKLGDSTVGFLVAERTLRCVLWVAGRAHLWFLEDAAARALRRFAQRRGARAQVGETVREHADV